MSADVNADTTYAINQKLRAEIEELRRKLAEQQAVLQLASKAFDKTAEEYKSGYLSGGSVQTSDLRVEAWRAAANCNTEELTTQLSAAKQEGYEQGKKAGRDEVLRELSPLFLFLNGEDCLEGVWFGEEPTLRGRFWWRTLLPKVIPSAPEKGEK